MAVTFRSTLAASTVDQTMTLSLPANVTGDHLYVFAVAYAVLGDTITPCGDFAAPDGWTVSYSASIVESATSVGQFAIFTRDVADPVATIELTSPVSAIAKQLTAVAMTVRDVGGVPGADITAAGPFQVADAPIPAVEVIVDDTVVRAMVMAVGQCATVELPAPYLWSSAQKPSVLFGSDVRFWSVPARSTSIPETATDITVPALLHDAGPGWYIAVAVALVPAAAPVATPTPPDLRRLRLGCADDYRVFITSNDYTTVIDGVGWSDLEWSRVLDESSTATVTLPDVYGGAQCCAGLGGLMPWRYGLKIERDDVPVWSGPVTNIQRVPEALRVSASDVMARFQKRLATRNLDLHLNMVDAGNAFAQIIIRAQDQLPDEAWHLFAPNAHTGKAIKRDILVREFELAWDILSDFAESSIDFWVGNGILYVFDVNRGWVYWDGTQTVVLPGPYSESHELVYGTFTESTFVDLPTWSVNGWAKANTAWVPGADVGESGARRYWMAQNSRTISLDGVLDTVETFNLYRPEDEEDIPEDVFQDFADSLVAVRGTGPPVIEGTILSQNAPVDVDHLRPGSIWQLDIFDACYGQLMQLGRLKRVTVRAAKSSDGLTETVEPVLVPLGHMED